jgi:hypothetical protein
MGCINTCQEAILIKQATMPFNGKIKNRVAPIRMIIEQIIEIANEKLTWVSNPRNKAGGKLDPVHKTNII